MRPALWTCDHLFWHRPLLEPLDVAGSRRHRDRDGDARHLRAPAPVAQPGGRGPPGRDVADRLSGGRFVLGLGVGSHPGEYEAAGVGLRPAGPAARRGHRCTAAGVVQRRRHRHAGIAMDPPVPGHPDLDRRRRATPPSGRTARARRRVGPVVRPGRASTGRGPTPALRPGRRRRPGPRVDLRPRSSSWSASATPRSPARRGPSGCPISTTSRRRPSSAT